MAIILLLFFLPIGNALFNTIVRLAQRRGSRVLFVGATNYIVACAVNVALALARRPVTLSPRTWQLGVVSGLVYALTFRLIAYSMHRRGLAVPSAVMQLSVIVPLGCSVFLWGERPELLQTAGIILALAALTLLAGDGKQDEEAPGLASAAPGLALLFGLFLLQGGAGLAPKAFSELAPAGETNLFLSFLFGTAALTFLPEWLGPVRPQRPDLLWGVALGATNAVTNVLSVYVMQRLPGILVFPVLTAGTLLITSGLGLLAWKEPVSAKGRAGMLVALGAVVLVSLK